MQQLAKLDPGMPVILVRPPVSVAALPQPGSSLDAMEAGCLDAMRRVANARPATALIDFRIDGPEAREARNWFDPTHYRGPLARAMEQAIATALLKSPAFRAAR